jgi:hypothetical protein
MIRLTALTAVLCAAAPAGARAAEPGVDAAQSYRVVTEGSTRELRPGGQGKVVLFIEPLAKVHVHPQAPLKIALEATPGLKLGKTSLGHADAVDPKAEAPRFEVPFVAEAKGKQEAKARLDFFICSDQWCVKQVKDVVVAVDVK